MVLGLPVPPSPLVRIMLRRILVGSPSKSPGVMRRRILEDPSIRPAPINNFWTIDPSPLSQSHLPTSDVEQGPEVEHSQLENSMEPELECIEDFLDDVTVTDISDGSDSEEMDVDQELIEAAEASEAPGMFMEEYRLGRF